VKVLAVRAGAATGIRRLATGAGPAPRNGSGAPGDDPLGHGNGRR
jgi:hypothetical protein